MDSGHPVSSIPDHFKSKTELASARPKQCPLGCTLALGSVAMRTACVVELCVYRQYFGVDLRLSLCIFKETQITSQ